VNLENHLTPEEAAARCRVSAEAIRHWIRSGITIGGRRVKLVAVRMGIAYRIDPAALDAFAAACSPDLATEVPGNPAKGAARRKAASEAVAKEIGGGL
jgi:excisionase family DNA binding protein